MRNARRNGLLVILTLFVASWAIGLNWHYIGFDGEKFIDIPRGASSYSIARMLANAGVVESRWDFLAARVIERGRALQAGEYRFNKPATPLEVYSRIARGDVFYYDLVVPEGRNMFDIAATAEKLGVFSAASFLKAARDPALIRDLDPHAPTLEGYLCPGSYRLSHNATPAQLCRMMTQKFRAMWEGLVTNANVHDAITLASMVEREGKLESDRPLIAAVFANRLRIGMKLDCDPTTIYAALLADEYRGVHPPVRSGSRQPLQHLSARRIASGADRQSRAALDTRCLASRHDQGPVLRPAPRWFGRASVLGNKGRARTGRGKIPAWARAIAPSNGVSRRCSRSRSRRP